MGNIADFLKSPNNSRARESIVNGKLFLDLKLAAAEKGYFLGIYVPEVDKEGFDIILDDGDSLRKVQLKTIMPDSKKRAWDLHKALLRPAIGENGPLGFEYSPTGIGYGGACVLMKIDVTDDFRLDYYYTDVYVLAALVAEVIDLTNGPTDKSLGSVLKDLQDGMSHETVDIRDSMFLAAKDASSLLGLLGLHGPDSVMMWSHDLTAGLKLDVGDAQRNRHFRNVNEQLAKACKNVVLR